MLLYPNTQAEKLKGGKMDLKPGQHFAALGIPAEVGQKFRDNGVTLEVTRVLTEEEVENDLPVFHREMRAIRPDAELYWVECKPYLS